MTIFTLSQQAEPSALIILPEKICNPNRAFFLNAKVLTPAKLKPEEVAFAGIPDPGKSSYNKSELTEYLIKIHQYVETMGIKVIAVGISAFWQALTDNKKFTLYFGRTLNGTVFKNSKEKLELDFSEYKICGFLNPILLNKYPNKLKEVVRGLSVIKPLIDGEEINSEEKVSDILKINKILTDPDEAYEVLVKLFYEPQLTCDIETTGLRWYADEMLTLSLSPKPGEAYCFAINYRYHNKNTEEKFIDILGRFFKKYEGEIIGHNFTAFDTAFIVHYIMRGRLFTERHEPLIDNLKLTDTMLMAYLLQNSTERPSIGLKEITFKWLGEYDADVDQRFLERYPLETVATYNNLDVHATWLAYNELKPKIDKEFPTLNKEFQEIAVDLLKLKMNGIRVDREAASKFLEELSGFIKKDKETMLNNKWIKLAQRVWAEQKLQKYNETHKNKKENWEEFIEEFNPNSPKQKYLLFFELMDLPPIKHSKKTKLPSADQESLNTWMADENIPEDKREAIVAISEYTLATKILNSYIKIMAQDSIEVAPGDFRIFADFNQTGTISGRLSSSGMINLQTIPSKSKYASFVKKMLIAPDGYVIATADYSALDFRGSHREICA